MGDITIKVAGKTIELDYPVTDTFVHPAFYTDARLDLVASKITAGAAPWKTKFDNLKTRKAEKGANIGKYYCDLTWKAAPIAEVGRGSSGSPNQGADDFMLDLTSALICTLIFRLTGDRRYGSKAAETLNAWGGKITKILFDTTTWSDGKLLAGWTGSIAGRAVDLLRTIYVPRSGEVVPDWKNIDRMLREVILPRATEWHTGSGGNWIASFVDATMQIGVALDDKDVFDLACARWRRVVPSLFYMSSDVNPYSQLQGLPIVPPWTQWDKSTVTAASIKSAWGNPTSWPNGLEFETFRDMHHTAMSFCAVANAGITAYNQGVMLLEEERTRIITATELITKFLYEWAQTNFTANPSGWPFTTPIKGYKTSFQSSTWVNLREYYTKLSKTKASMPNTDRWINSYVTPSSWTVDLHSVAEQLTQTLG